MVGKMRILVVDDEKVVREGCHRVLDREGYEVASAENGRQALDTLQENHVDIMLLDLKMPGMSGEEVLDAARSDYPSIPVIIITGHGTIDTAVECMKRGAYDFITKPFQIDQFVLTVNRAADKRKLEQKALQFQEENRRNLYDLHLEKSRIKTIINCMANGVMVANRSQEVVLHNPALMRLLETQKTLPGPVPVNSLVTDRGFMTGLTDLQSNTSKNKVLTREIQVGNRQLRAISAPLLGPDDDSVGTVTVLEDITAFRQLDQMKSDFVNMVAHELRSPLVALRQQNSVLLEGLAGPLEDKQEDFISRGTKKIDGLLELINDLLDVAKIEAGKAVQHQVPTDIGKIIEEVVALMQARASELGVSLTHTCENLEPVRVDPKRIEEVFNNLITNAVNYSPGGGKVVVSAQALGEYLEIRVSDTGVGIPEEELPKIFDKFYRVKDPKTRQVVGTGLGLAIVKGVVEAHRGTIDVQSRAGEGTTFKILLPLEK